MVLLLFAILLSVPVRALAAEPWGDRALTLTDGLELWLDCSHQNDARGAVGLPALSRGLPVEHLFDASGKRRHFVQYQRAGKPVVRQEDNQTFLLFDGKENAMTAAALGTRLQEATIFILAAPHSNAGFFRAFLSLSQAGRNDYVSGLNIDLGPEPTAQLSRLAVEGAGCPGSGQLLKGSPRPFGGWHLFTLVTKAGPGGVALAIDGEPQGTRDRSPSEIALDDMALGARLYSNTGVPPYLSGNFHGGIAEVLVYGRALDAGQRTQVERYLKEKHAALLQRPPGLDDGTKPLVTVTNPPPVQWLVPGFVARELPVTLKNINGVKYRPDGKLVALGYNGEIHLLSDSNGDGLEDRVEPFWRGDSLRAPIGMALTPPNYARGEGVFVAAKGKVSLLVDTNHDGRADQELIVADGWKEISHGVDALGVAVDREGNIFFGLGTANFTDAYLLDRSTGTARYDLKSERGTILKVSPDFKRREVVCTGIRFPVALAFNASGDLFCTDQEGATWLPDGNPLDELLHIQPGRHYGFPPRHPKHLPGVIDEPSVFDYAPQHQSTCGLNFNEPVNGSPSTSSGKGASFGPAWWRGDALVCGYSRGKIWRTQLVQTDAGYVAQSQLLGCLPTLAVDACVSPAGALVLATHSGEPDWGSGPSGTGHLYQVRYARADLPQPVLCWPNSPSEIRIGFDRPLDFERLKDLRARTDITQAPFATAGERFETKRPGYEVVQSQLAAPRYDVPVQSVSFTPERRTLSLHTKMLEAPAGYAITLRDFTSVEKGAGILPQVPALDLLLQLNGLAAMWEPAPSNLAARGKTNRLAPWEGWLPHPALAVARQLTAGVAEYQALWTQLQQPGQLTLRGQLELWQMLQPAIQPGAKLDYERPTEEVTVVWRAPASFKATLANQSASSEKAADGSHRVSFKHVTQKNWLPFEVVLTTGASEAGLTMEWFTAADPRPRAFPLRRFFVPWAKQNLESGAPAKAPMPRELAGGHWLRGKELFFGETAACFKCHRIRDEGTQVGPDLSNLIHRDYASVLKDIRFPNAALNPDHLAYTIQLKDDEPITAVVLRETPDAVTVADAAGQRRVPRSQVKSIQPTGLSLMPEGLDQALNAEQLRDLMTFLLTTPLEPSPIAIPGLPPARKLAELKSILGPASGQKPASKPFRILLSAGPKDHGENEHDYPLWQQRWSKLLALSGNVTVHTVPGFPSRELLQQNDVVVFYSNNPGWSAGAARELQEYQQRGGGLVYVHFAVDGHSDVEALVSSIGLAWRGGRSKFRHGPLELTFPSTHPITKGFSKLQLVDESYWNMDGDEHRIDLLASGPEEGKPQPLLWARENGPGRVFVSIPGHYTWTFDDPLFRLLLLRGICWSAHQHEDRLSELTTIGARVDYTGEAPATMQQAKQTHEHP